MSDFPHIAPAEDGCCWESAATDSKNDTWVIELIAQLNTLIEKLQAQLHK